MNKTVNVATEPGVSEFANTQIVGALQNAKIMPILRLKSTDSASKAGELIKEISSLKTKPIDVNRPVISSKPNINTVGSKTIKSSSGSANRIKNTAKTPSKVYQDKVSAARAAALAAARKKQQDKKAGKQATILPVNRKVVGQPIQNKILSMFRS